MSKQNHAIFMCMGQSEELSFTIERKHSKSHVNSEGKALADQLLGIQEKKIKICLV